MARRKRKSNNPEGRPVTVDARASFLLRLPPMLLKKTRAAARAEGISLSAWWRDAALRALAKKGGR